MYRVFFSFAFLVFCSAAPYGGYGGSDLSSTRSFQQPQQQQFVQQPQEQQFGQQPQQQQFGQQTQQPQFGQQTQQQYGQQTQQPIPFVNTQQQQQPQGDDSDLVDTLGAGYSFFRKQPVSSRPLVQQKLVSEQQIPITSLDDTSNQWSDYTKASAFKQLPIQKPTLTASHDLLTDGGYGQQQSAPRTAVNVMSTLVQDNLQQPIHSSVSGGYGSALNQDQTQDLSWSSSQQQPQDLSWSSSQQQPQQQPQDLSWATTQQRPLIRTLGSSGYGQQQQQQQPLIRSFGGYGQQQQQDVQSIIPQMLIRKFGGYGQQQQQLDIPKISMKLSSGYGQQVQPSTPDLSQVDWSQQMQQPVVQPTLKTLNSGYGQQVQQQQQFDQPIISMKTSSGYGQQAQPSTPDLSQVDWSQQMQQPVVQPTLKTLNSGYGQQQQQQQQQLDQPIISMKTSSGYGQQAQPSTIDWSQVDWSQQMQQPTVQPSLKTLSSGYGQQVQQPLVQPSLKTISSGYGQQAQSINNDLSQVDWSQQIQQPVVQPSLKTLNSGYGQQVQQPLVQPTSRTISSGYGQQQQPDFSSGQSMTDLSQSNSAFMPSSRMAFQGQPTGQMLGQRAFGGY